MLVVGALIFADSDESSPEDVDREIESGVPVVGSPAKGIALDVPWREGFEISPLSRALETFLAELSVGR